MMRSERMTAEEAIKVLRDIKLGIFIDTYFDEPEKIVSKENEALEIAIKALEQQPCEDCISREAVEKITWEEPSYDDALNVLTEVRDKVRALPTVTPKAKTGRWIDIQYFKADDTYYRPKCPFCSIEPKEYSNYCPNCGARMEGNA